MATIEKFRNGSEFEKITSQIRTTVQTAFFGNNTQKIETLAEAYEMAKTSMGTIELTGMPIYEPEKQGLPKDANVLLFNDGSVFGRCAAARRIVGEPGVDMKAYSAKIREAVYNTRYRKMYHAEALVGLDSDFTVKAHLLIPERHENILYSWMLNFQYLSEAFKKMYANSRKLPDGDIYIFSDPDWKHEDHPLGLTFFDP